MSPWLSAADQQTTTSPTSVATWDETGVAGIDDFTAQQLSVVCSGCDQLKTSTTTPALTAADTVLNGSTGSVESPTSSSSAGLVDVVSPLSTSASSPVLRRVDSKSLTDKEPVSTTSPKHRKATRKNRFHKLFPDIAESDAVIKSYHCAYVSDILLQGFLYVTHNWFCFYSKLLGKRRIKIDVSSVTNITKKKTAIIIPNAVGIVTVDHQYVFGSLMSRDNTFRLLCGVWQQTLLTNVDKPVIGLLGVASDTVDGESLATKSLVTVSSISTSSEDLIASSSSDDSFCSDAASSCGEQSSVTSNHINATARADNIRQRTSTSAVPWTHRHCGVRVKKLLSAFRDFVHWLSRLPRTCVFLLISTLLVVLLLCSASVLTYRLLQLQATLDSRRSTVYDLPLIQNRHRLVQDMYTLRHDYDMSAVNEMHSVLQAHVQLLDQVSESLKGLYQWVVTNRQDVLRNEH